MLTNHEIEGWVLEKSYRLSVAEGMFCICTKFKFRVQKHWMETYLLFFNPMFCRFSLDLLPFMYFDIEILSFSYLCFVLSS